MKLKMSKKLARFILSNDNKGRSVYGIIVSCVADPKFPTQDLYNMVDCVTEIVKAHARRVLADTSKKGGKQ